MEKKNNVNSLFSELIAAKEVHKWFCDYFIGQFIEMLVPKAVYLLYGITAFSLY